MAERNDPRTKEELLKYAESKGYSISPTKSKAEILEALDLVEQAHKKQAMDLNSDSSARWCKKKGEKMIAVKFLNLDSPGADEAFTLDANANPPYKFHLFDGEIYELPIGVIKHLNSLIIPDYKTLIEPTTGLVRSHKAYRNKFSCVPLELSAIAV